MIEVVGGFPVIEDLIAILNRGIRRCESIGNKTDVKSGIQREIEPSRGRPSDTSTVFSSILVKCDGVTYFGFARDAPWVSLGRSSSDEDMIAQFRYCSPALAVIVINNAWGLARVYSKHIDSGYGDPSGH
jgi:hypothetical protein